MRSLRSVVLIGSVVLGESASAQVQDTTARRTANPLLQTWIGGGFAKTSWTPGSSTTHGFNLQGALALRTPFEPLRLRLDLFVTNAGATRVEGLNANLLLRASERLPIVPYFLAGGGAYGQFGSKPSAGWNVGAGVTLPLGDRAIFMESRFHSYRDKYAGQPWLIPGGGTSIRHEEFLQIWHPLTFGFRF